MKSSGNQFDVEGGKDEETQKRAEMVRVTAWKEMSFLERNTKEKRAKHHFAEKGRLNK